MLRGLLAFTLIEIMVTIGLLSLIVLGLMAMFNQTQRAFRTGMKQTDVLETGRGTIDMMIRDLEQMVPSDYPYLKVNGAFYAATNFFVEPSPGFYNPLLNVATPPPLLQELPGSSYARTNLVQRFFFVSKANQDWLGTAYQVLPDDGNFCVGTLYRFSGTNASRLGPMTISAAIQRAADLAERNALAGVPVTNVANVNVPPFNQSTWIDVNRVADGIVHLRVRAFAANGSLVVTNATGAFNTNGMFALLPLGPYTNVWDSIVFGNRFYDPAQTAAAFMKEAVPGFVEIELGVLEPDILKRYRSIPVAAVQRQYLSNHVAEVHIFRQRIPIRNVEFTAYP